MIPVKPLVILLLAPLALLSCNPYVVDPRPLFQPPPVPPVQAFDGSVNLLENSALDFPFRAWEFGVADQVRGELKAGEGNYGYQLYEGFFLDPGDYCLKITHSGKPESTEYAYWQQTTDSVDLGGKTTLSFTAWVHGQSVERGGIELAVEWAGGRRSVTVDKSILSTYIHIDGLPVYPVNFEIPVVGDMALPSNTFTVKLMVQPGSVGQFFFDEIYLVLR
jgi:hypothetical protein